MQKSDIGLLVERMMAATREHVADAVGSVALRLQALEAKLAALPAPQQGERGERGERGEPGAPAAPVDMAALIELVKGEIKAQVASLPAPERGEIGPQGERGEPGQPAAPADIEALKAFLIGEIKMQVGNLPPAQKGDPGESVTVDQACAALMPAVESMIAKIKPEKGEKGDPGEDGSSVHPDTVALMVREAADKVVATLPKPKDGADGFSLEDFSAETSEDGRTLTLKFERGTSKREFNLRLRAVKYCGIWEQSEHNQDDIVTLGGSAWIAVRETSERPGTPGVDTGWRLMVKEGRAGKDGVMKPAPVHQVVKTA